MYRSNALSDEAVAAFDVLLLNQEEKDVLDKVFLEYASLSSWSLSRLTHSEHSWQNSRDGVNEYANSDRVMLKSDIRKDALYRKYSV